MQAVEQGCQDSSGLGESFTELTGHVSEAASNFFKHWLHLIELEEAPGLSKRAEIWNTAGERHLDWLCTTIPVSL